MKELTDADKMPFGQHRGKPMEDVPASWLFWFWNNADRRSIVGRYIERNLDALEKELPDGIWR